MEINSDFEKQNESMENKYRLEILNILKTSLEVDAEELELLRELFVNDNLSSEDFIEKIKKLS